MVFSVFSIAGVSVLTASAAETPNVFNGGGVKVIFTTDQNATETNVDFIDTSSGTYYLKLINNSSQNVTSYSIKDEYQILTLVSGSNSTLAKNGGVAIYKINATNNITETTGANLYDTTARYDTGLNYIYWNIGDVYDFTVTYTLENVYYLSNGTRTQATFTQPAYIGAWNTSDDPKNLTWESSQNAITRATEGIDRDSERVISIKNKNGNVDVGIGFEVAQDSKSIIYQTQLNESGHGSREHQSVSTVIQMFVDTTDLGERPSWGDIEFRMTIKNWANTRRSGLKTYDLDAVLNRSSDSKAGWFALGSNAVDTSKPFSLALTNVMTSWSKTTGSVEVTAGGDRLGVYGNGQLNTTAKRVFGDNEGSIPKQSTRYFAFVGDIFTTDANNTQYRWQTDSYTIGDTLFELTGNDGGYEIFVPNGDSNAKDGFFDVDIYFYVFDKINLHNLVQEVESAGLLSGRYNSGKWNTYVEALKKATSILAAQKTDQYLVNDAYTNLKNAYDDLEKEGNVINKVVEVTHSLYSGDRATSLSSVVEYVLVNKGDSYTPALYSGYANQYNKHDIPTAYTDTSSNLGTLGKVTLNYWNINYRPIQEAIAAIDHILNSDHYQDLDTDNYPGAYRAKLTEYKNTLAGYMSEPVNQPLYDSTVTATINAAKALYEDPDKANHHKKVTLTYDLNYNGIGDAPTVNGTQYSDTFDVSVLYDEAYTVITKDKVSRTAYTFKGWYTAPEGGEEVSAALNLKADTTVYAQWDPIIYTITIVLRDGQFKDPAQKTEINYTIESRITIPNPVKEGWTFKGWEVTPAKGTTWKDNSWSEDKKTLEDEDENDSTSHTFSGKYGNITLTAQWGINEYTVTFDFNETNLAFVEGEFDRVDDFEVTYNNTIPKDQFPEDPTVKGYKFLGWFTDETDPDTEYKNDPITDDTTLYAHWEALPYTISYSIDGISQSPVAYTIEDHKNIADPTKVGYDFAGWKITEVDEDNNWGAVDSVITSLTDTYKHYGNVTLEAQWTPETYTVTFNPNGGVLSGNATATVEYNAILENVPSVDRTGYTFAGWWTEAENGEQVNTADPWSIDPESGKEITLYAHWNPIPYTATFITTIGTIADSGKKTYIKDYDITTTGEFFPTVTKTLDDGAYTFMGWSTEGNESDGGNWAAKIYKENELYKEGDPIPANSYGNVIFTAVWEANHTHTYTDWVSDNNGKHYKQCECGEKTDAVDCVYDEIVVAATCTEAGYTTYKCQVCQYEDMTRRTPGDPATGHKCDETTLDKARSVAPDCLNGGYNVYKCPQCGQDVYETLEALGHSWGEYKEVSVADCTHIGIEQRECARCHEIDEREIPVKGHTYLPENAVVIEPTCTERGYTTNSCILCGEARITDEKQPLGHVYEYTTVDATCTTDGYTEAYCLICQHTEKQNIVKALGHDYYVTVVEPTCTSGGYTEHFCTRCYDTYRDEPTKALGHDYVLITVSPSCTEQGYDSYECSRCHIGYKENYTKPTGHNFIKVGEIPATGTRNGYIVYECENCHIQYQEIIYIGGKALVCATLKDYNGRPVQLAEITATNMITGETFGIMTDLNGYFTYVFPEGTWRLDIHKDLYRDEVCYLEVAGGLVNGQDGKEFELPILVLNDCDCLCHQTSIWAKLFRVIYKLLKLFKPDIQCCYDSTI